jgi:NADPH-dependent glutamate synthase beta subunit-like oxidoreductase
LLLYRRSEAEMKVWKGELDEAKKQGVGFQFLTSPVEVLGEDHVVGIRCRRNRLSNERDSSGRPIPVEVSGTDFVIETDSLVIAIGQQIKADIVQRFERTKQGYIKVDATFQTSIPGVFAGGDAIAGEGTIVQSVAHGKQAALEIQTFLQHR